MSSSNDGVIEMKTTCQKARFMPKTTIYNRNYIENTYEFMLYTKKQNRIQISLCNLHVFFTYAVVQLLRSYKNYAHGIFVFVFAFCFVLFRFVFVLKK